MPTDMSQKQIKSLLAARHSHHLWDDMSKCNNLPHEPPPSLPGERRRSTGPTADPEGPKLKDKQTDR